jgi:transposase
MSGIRQKNVPSKEELETLYLQEGSTISSVARHYSTTNPTIRGWLNRYEIPRKSHKQASIEANNRHRINSKPTKKDLENLYSENNIKSLEKYYNVGQQTIYDWLTSYDIKIKTINEACKQAKERKYKDIYFDKEFLNTEYDRTKSISELADKLNVSRSHIRQQLVINNIKIEPIEPSWRSKAEIELYEFLVLNFPDDNWKSNDKTIINPFELDIVNFTKNIAIEYCGLYWHAEFSSGKKSDYHKKKYQECKEKGFKLITIFESDDMDKIKKLLLKLLGKTERIYARKTIIKQIKTKTAKDFHEKYHLHGFVGASYHYGLYNNEELVMVGSFGKNRFSKKYEYECTRLTSGDITVVGGVSKIFKHFVKNVNPKSIVTFADLRFGNGKSYLNCGFEEIGTTPQNYWYFKKNIIKLFSRVKFQKHKLKDILENFDPDKTEYENMINNNWDRIWDCGNAKYIWTNSSQ